VSGDENEKRRTLSFSFSLRLGLASCPLRRAFSLLVSSRRGREGEKAERSENEKGKAFAFVLMLVERERARLLCSWAAAAVAISGEVSPCPLSFSFPPSLPNQVAALAARLHAPAHHVPAHVVHSSSAAAAAAAGGSASDAAAAAAPSLGGGGGPPTPLAGKDDDDSQGQGQQGQRPRRVLESIFSPVLTLFGSSGEGKEAGAGAGAGTGAAAGPSSEGAAAADADEQQLQQQQQQQQRAVAAASLPGSKAAHAAAHHHDLNRHSHHRHDSSHGASDSRATPPAAGPLASSSLRPPPPSPAAVTAAAAAAALAAAAPAPAGENGVATAVTPSTDGESDTCVDGGSLSETGAAAAATTATAATTNNNSNHAAASAAAAAAASAAAAVAAAATATAAAAAAATSAAAAAAETRSRDVSAEAAAAAADSEDDADAEDEDAEEEEEEEEEECDDEFVEFDPYAFIKALPPLDARLPPSALGIDIGIDETEIGFSPSRGRGDGDDNGSSSDGDGDGGDDDDQAEEEAGDADEEGDLEEDLAGSSSRRRPRRRQKRLRTLGDVLRARPPLLPPVGRTRAAAARPTLVLDLDETLVHSTLGPGPVALTSPEAASGISGVGGRKGQPPPPGAVSRFSFDVALAGRTHAVHVRTRPHLLPFLERCARLFEVVVFTASQKVYAEQLLDVLDPGRRLIRHRVFRDSCVVFEGNYLKDLSALGRDLSRVVIVDNSPQAFGFQLDNGIPIESWYDDDRDDELRRLLPLLESLAASEDVRPLLASAFQLRKLVERAPSLAPASFLA